MAFSTAWIESDPDGSVITVSELDDYIRTAKAQIRERLEGDPTVQLSGIFESGSFSTTAQVRKGTARAAVDTAVNMVNYASADGRLFVATDTKRMYVLQAAGAIELGYLPLSGGTIAGNLGVTGNFGANGAIGTGKAGSGTGGQVQVIDDGGTLRWALGIAASAGARNFFLYDNVRAVNCIVVDYTNGNTTFVAQVTATQFNGSGAGLTAVPGGSVSGTVASANSVPASGITGSIADSQISGLSASKLSGALPAISGYNLTSINGANVSGTVASATNAAQLGGVAAASYAQLSGATFTGAVHAPAYYVG